MAQTIIEGEGTLFVRIFTPEPVDVGDDMHTLRRLAPGVSGRFLLGDVDAGWELEDEVHPGPAATPQGWAWDPWTPALRVLRLLVGCPWR